MIQLQALTGAAQRAVEPAGRALALGDQAEQDSGLVPAAAVRDLEEQVHHLRQRNTDLHETVAEMEGSLAAEKQRSQLLYERLQQAAAQLSQRAAEGESATRRIAELTEQNAHLRKRIAEEQRVSTKLRGREREIQDLLRAVQQKMDPPTPRQGQARGGPRNSPEPPRSPGRPRRAAAGQGGGGSPQAGGRGNPVRDATSACVPAPSS